MRRAAAILLLTLACLEIANRIRDRRGFQTWRGTQRGHPAALHEIDPWLGPVPRKDLDLRMRVTRAGRTLYDVRYHTDRFGRRVTPLSSVRPARRRFALFMGCSYTFGIGVNDDETLPAAFGRERPGWRPYNYGVSGAGPQVMLARLQRGRMRAEIDEPIGDLIYTFIDDHVARVAGAPHVLAWGAHLPYYDLDEKGRLQRRGDFQEGRHLASVLYETLALSSFARLLLNLTTPLRLGEREVDLTARILIASRERFRELFPESRFWVLLYPGNRRYAPVLRPKLERAGIRIVDGTSLDFPPERYRLADGLHPNALAYREIARRLAGTISP